MTLPESRGNKNLGERVKVLLADDSVTMHRAVRLALKNEPFEVLTCDNGQDALRLCLDHHPRIVLADLDMPIMTGPELTLAIKKNPQLQSSKVILLCGSFDQVDESRLGAIPADGRIWKPFEAHTLVALLKTLLTENQNSPAVRETITPTGALGLPALLKMENVKTSQDITSPELEKDLMEETFKQAELASTQEILRQSTEPTGIALNVTQKAQRQEMPAPHLKKSAPAKQENLKTFSESDETEATVTNAQAMENLWSDDFKAEQTVVPEINAASTTHQSAENRDLPTWDESPQNPLKLGDDFEIVTSSFNINQRELPAPQHFRETQDDATLEIPSFNPAPLELKVDMDEFASNPLNSEFDLQDPPSATPTLLSADEWVKDRDFSDYQLETNIQEHHYTESPMFQEAKQQLENVILTEGSAAPLSEEQIRKLIQQEILGSVKGILKELLQEELSKVLSEIERD